MGACAQRDRIEHAQISPAAATNTGVASKDKLAGSTLGHFGGFLDRGWRHNDLMWGRLDGAEVLIRAILGEDQSGAHLDEVQEAIVRAEMPELAEAAGGWRAGLQAHAEGDRSDGELNGRRLLSIGLRAASIVRKMLRSAAAETSGSGLLQRSRAFTLRAVANLLAFALALVYLPSTAFFAKGSLVRRGATLLAFLPFLWGVATMALGLLGVLDLGDVAGPAAIGILIYPLFVAIYWGIGLLAGGLGHFKRGR
jgi:hypothetical protein